jgi:hypothetical protein
MPRCSRCGSRVPDPWCYVCAPEPEEAEAAEEAAEKAAKCDRETED